MSEENLIIASIFYKYQYDTLVTQVSRYTWVGRYIFFWKSL